MENTAGQKTQQLHLIEHEQLILSKYIWNLSNRRARPIFCIA